MLSKRPPCVVVGTAQKAGLPIPWLSNPCVCLIGAGRRPRSRPGAGSRHAIAGSFSELEPPAASSRLYQPSSSTVTADEVDRLVHYFHRRCQGDACYQKEAGVTLARLSD